MGQCFLKDCGFKYEKNHGFSSKTELQAYIKEHIIKKRQEINEDDDIEELNKEQEIIFDQDGQTQVKFDQTQEKLQNSNNIQQVANQINSTTKDTRLINKYSIIRSSHSRNTFQKFNQKDHFFNQLKGNSQSQLQNYIFEKISPMNNLEEENQMIFTESDWKEDSSIIQKTSRTQKIQEEKKSSSNQSNSNTEELQSQSISQENSQEESEELKTSQESQEESVNSQENSEEKDHSKYYYSQASQSQLNTSRYQLQISEYKSQQEFGKISENQMSLSQTQ